MNDPGIVKTAPNLAKLLAEGDQGRDEPGLQDRARGTILGLAAGNVLGLPVESWWYSDIDQRYPDGVIDIDPLEKWRPMDDDLAQAVEIAEAVLEVESTEHRDPTRLFAEGMVRWLDENGRGIGHTTDLVVSELRRGTPPPEAAKVVYDDMDQIAPNGAVMRCAPVALARLREPEQLIKDSVATCVVTHYAPTCQWSCIIINTVIALFVRGEAPDLTEIYRTAISDGAPDLAGVARADGIANEVWNAIEAGNDPPPTADWLRVNQRLIGHTLLATQCGLWAATTPLSLEDALIQVIGGGGDTDTNGAVAGAVLGARYGASAIPQRWLDCLPQLDRLTALADSLVA